jgi:hypothetical protein
MVHLLIAFLMVSTDVAHRQNGTVNRTLLSIIICHENGTSDVTIDLTRNLWMRIFAPAEHVKGEKLPLVIYIHDLEFLDSGKLGCVGYYRVWI